MTEQKKRDLSFVIVFKVCSVFILFLNLRMLKRTNSMLMSVSLSSSPRGLFECQIGTVNLGELVVDTDLRYNIGVKGNDQLDSFIFGELAGNIGGVGHDKS